MSANTTPDATATPRSGVPDAEYWKAHYERIERELAAAKAEIARVTADFDRVTSTLYDRVNDVIALKDRAERAEAQLRERTQWQCACGGTDCAGQAENERLRAEVTKLKAHEGDLVIGAAILEGARKQEAREVDQLRARVAELEADKARLDWLLSRGVCWRGCNAELMGEGWVVGHETEWLYDVQGQGRARIDKGIAARDGKGAT